MKLIKVDIEFNDGRSNLVHSYPVPYERNDDFIMRTAENNPLSVQSDYEPAFGKSLYADVDFEYNYYNKKYELRTVGVDENVLPSLNYFLLYSNNMMEDKLYNYLFYYGVPSSSVNFAQSFLSDQYFENYADNLTQSPVSPALTGIEEITRVVNSYDLKTEFISKEMIDIYSDVENKREMFPFYSKIHMTGMKDSTFCGILEESGLDKIFVDYLIMHREDLNNPFTTSVAGVAMEPMIDPRIKLYSPTTFYAHINSHSGMSYSYSANSLESQTDTCSVLENVINTQIGLQKIKDYIISMEGSGSVETIAFRLEKYSDDGTLINVKYFLNYTDLEEFRLYDTQVLYGKRYNYFIKAINLVFDSGRRGVYIIEEAYYTDYFTVLDNPPITPDVEIVTYRGVSDRILIMANSVIDQKVLAPVIINPSDRDGYERQWDAQKIEPENPILFETDDPAQYFEMFRLEEKPSSYQDFVNGKYIVFGREGSTAAGYNDMIVPNKTYYYIFRALDVHQHVSIPTVVYEFRLNKEGETLYPTLRVADFKPKDPPTQKNISFKRFLKIGLTPSQYQIPESLVEQIDSLSNNQLVEIGTSGDNILTPVSDNANRKFKFRIRSKNTGKLLDINITFKKNGVFIE